MEPAMRIRTDVDRIRTFTITSPAEVDHYEEMMKSYFRTEMAKIPVADYTGTSVEEWSPKRRAILKKLAAAVGPFPERKVPLKAKVNAKYDRGDYTVEGVSFFARPNWPVSALFYLPKKAKRPVPAVLLVHGHSFIQKAYPTYQKVAIHLARNGYAVLAVDFVGGGERKAQGHENLFMSTAGMTVQGLMIWDNMRAVDYLISRREVDGRRIGITGSSGGGNQAAFTTVMDERIMVSCPVNAVCMFNEHETVGNDSFCPCEVLPGIWQFAEYSDLMATVAPRPLLISQSVKDRLFPIKGAREVVNRAREIYRAYGVPENIDIHEDYGPHSYAMSVRVGVIRWFDKFLKGIEAKPLDAYEDYTTVEHESSEVLFGFPDGKLPKGVDTLDSLFAKACEELPHVKRPRTRATYKPYARGVLAHLSKLAARPHELGDFDFEEYPTVKTAWSNIRPFSFTAEPGIVIPSILIEPLKGTPNRVVLYVHAEGKDRAIELRSVQHLVESGAAVLSIDTRGTGETSGVNLGHSLWFTLNRSIMLGRHISMMRAFDIVRAVDCLKTISGYARTPVYVWGEAEAATWALFAFALDPRVKRLATTDMLVTYRSKSGFTQTAAIFPPNMLFGADVPDIIAATLGRKALIARPQMPSGASDVAQARKALAPTFDAAHAAGLAAPKLVSGGYEETEGAVRRFLMI
jgi:cephalosporin-C deacetylase-like acetyl esterase